MSHRTCSKRQAIHRKRQAIHRMRQLCDESRAVRNVNQDRGSRDQMLQLQRAERVLESTWGGAPQSSTPVFMSVPWSVHKYHDSRSKSVSNVGQMLEVKQKLFC